MDELTPTNGAVDYVPPPEAPGSRPPRMGLSSMSAPAKVETLDVDRAQRIINKLTADPSWLADPRTSAAANGVFSAASKVIAMNLQMQRVNSQTEAAKSILADTQDFTKRLAAIPASDRAALRSMEPGRDGGPSKDQWDALGLVEQRMETQRQNEASRAEIEALQRGDQPTTTITDKGVATTFRPAPPAKPAGGGTPQTKTLADGTVLAWMPQGNTIHVIKGDNSVKMTPTQLSNLSKGLSEDDPDKQFFLDAAKSAAKTSIEHSTKPAAAAPATAGGTGYDAFLNSPFGQKYKSATNAPAK